MKKYAEKKKIRKNALICSQLQPIEKKTGRSLTGGESGNLIWLTLVNTNGLGLDCRFRRADTEGWGGEAWVGDIRLGERFTLLPAEPGEVKFCSSSSRGVERGGGNWSTDKSGREPAWFEIGMWIPDPCSCDG